MKRFLLSSLLALCLPASLVMAQGNTQPRKTAPVDSMPLYCGTTVGVDLAAPVMGLIKKEYIGSEVSLKVNIKNRFIPVLEAGAGQVHKVSETGIEYTGKLSPFFRVGMDYNLLHKRQDKNYFLFAGLRYAFSRPTYSVKVYPLEDELFGQSIPNPLLTDDVWGGSLSHQATGQTANVQWMELLLGVKVKLYRALSVGWSIRAKYLLRATKPQEANPWYVPGYGKMKSDNLDVTYSLIYELPF